MPWKLRFGKKLTFALASALAFAATSSSNDAAAQTADKSVTSKTSSSTSAPTRAAVFATYDMLDAAATKAALDAHIKRADAAGARTQLLAALNDKKLNAARLEKAVQPFVAGLHEDVVHVRLDAIMRDYYLTALERKQLSMSQVTSLMTSRARALDDAVFGKTASSSKTSGTKKPRETIQSRHRLRARR